MNMFKRVSKFLMYLYLHFLFETAQVCYTVIVNMLNKDNSTELNSCIAYSTNATYDVYHMGKTLKL